MAPVLANSPELACASTFKSPLHTLGAEVCERVLSEEMYGDSQARLTQWRKDLVMSAKFDAQQGLRELQHENEHLKDLQTDLACVQGLVQTASQLQAGGARLSEVVHSSSDAAGSRAKAMARVCKDLNVSCEMHRQMTQQVSHDIAERQEAADSHHEEALKLLGTYKDRLGLAITRVAPQIVCMSFTLLDQSDLAREFSFTIGLADSKGYCVNVCMPKVPELPELLAELNANAAAVTSLPRFVCSMRRAFIKLAGDDQAA